MKREGRRRWGGGEGGQEEVGRWRGRAGGGGEVKREVRRRWGGGEGGQEEVGR